MAHVVFNSAYGYIADGTIKPGSDSFKCALFPSTWTADPDTDEDWADISADECTGSGYTAGGVALSGVAWTRDNGNNRYAMDATDPRYEDVTIADAGFAVIYKDAVAPGDRKLLVALDLGGAQNSPGVPMIINFPSDGFLFMRQG